METAIQNWGHQKYQTWPSIGGSTMGATQLDDEFFDDALSRSFEHPSLSQDVTVLVSCDLEGAKSDQERRCQPKKIYWRSKHLIDYFTNVWKNFFVYEGLEDYSESQSEAVATMHTLPNIWSHTEHEEFSCRGVYTPKFKRNVIFTKTLKLKTSELPRWKPTAIIGKRNFEVEDAQ